MSKMIEKYSFGIGDRFARQGKAQLEALVQAKKLGVDLVPVWNKSFRQDATEPSKQKKKKNCRIAGESIRTKDRRLQGAPVVPDGRNTLGF